jgi:Tfp pilus assembly protein PilF
VGTAADARALGNPLTRVSCHRPVTRTFLVAVIIAAMTAQAGAESPALPILKNAIAHAEDRQVLTDSLAAIERVLAGSAADPDAHYARGWVLSRLDRGEDAVGEYDRAFALDPTLVDAAYNAGVVLGTLHRDADAATRFDEALAIAPKHVDAAYNAGQAYYNVKDFKHAAERWATARKLTPDNFQIAKKLVQAYNALGDATAAATARDAVFALWKAGKAGKLKDYVFDQFEVDGHVVFAYETFDTSGDLAYVYRFDVIDSDKVVGSVNLETSAGIREMGTPYILGMDRGRTHTSLGAVWKQLPTYKELRPIVVHAIEQRFGKPAP